MMTEPLEINSEADLLARVKAGTREAFSAVVSHYGLSVHKVAYRILQDDARAADVAQETFVELFRCAPGIKSNLGGWLCRVASRHALDELRSERARRRREEAYQRQLLLRGPTSLQAQVHEAMLRLSSELRDILRDRYLERKTRARIAAERRLSESTVSRRLIQGLQEIRRILREEGAAIGLAPLHLLLTQNGQYGFAVLTVKISSVALALKCSVARVCEHLWHTVCRVLRSAVVKTAAAGLFATLAVLHLSVDLRTFISSQKKTPPRPAIYRVRDGETAQQMQPATGSQLPGSSRAPNYAGIAGPNSGASGTNQSPNGLSVLGGSIPLTMPSPEELARIDAQNRTRAWKLEMSNYLVSPSKRIVTTNGDQLLVKGGRLLYSNGIRMAPHLGAGLLSVEVRGTNVIETRSASYR